MCAHRQGEPRVLIDATALPAQLGGVGRYLEGLLAGIAAAGGHVWVVAKRQHLGHLRSLAPTHSYIAAPAGVERTATRFVWEQTRLPQLVGRLDIDVLHSPHYTFPLRVAARRVVTMHDATFFSDPESHTAAKRRFFGWWLHRAARADVAMIAPSAATLREVQRYVPAFGAATVIHHGAAEDFAPPAPDELAAFRSRHGLGDDPWIAYLGTIEPRKRVPMLMRAHARLRSADAAAPLLLISGQRGWDAEAAAMLDASDERSGVRELGYLPHAELRSLLGGATLVAYPSRAEGFGLPVLEAMRCGAPVVTSSDTALPEVGGDAAAYADSEDELVDVMQRVLADDAMRERMRSAGIERAATFTWEAAGRAHLDVYRQA